MTKKYITVEHYLSSDPLVIVFDQMLEHKTIAMPFGDRVRSAGMCCAHPDGRWVAFGCSTTLNMKYHPDDSELISLTMRTS